MSRMSKVICPKLLGKLKVIGVASTRLARSITIKRNPAPHTYSSAYVQLLNARPKPHTDEPRICKGCKDSRSFKSTRLPPFR
ncbi:hypothetical protein DRO47_02250 [Candidatus Bathyarchaeota archaeon]|nr:MAG: hypothetical protein DRO47_02250 [Candidatus Bathyarchaeota archaeon]